MRASRRNLVLEGRNIVLEALLSGHRPHKILMDRKVGLQQKMESILALAQKKGITVHRVEREILDRASITGVHQGVIALVKHEAMGWTLTGLLDRLKAEGQEPFLLVLCRVLLEQNLGALLRTGDASGVHGVVIPTRGGADPSPEVIRVSAGAALHLPVIREGIMAALKTMKRRGLWVIGAEAGTGMPYYEADLTGPTALVLGGEDRGLGEAVQKQCDFLIHLPLLGRVPSLNVGAAGAVLMYEKVRQEHLKKSAGPAQS